MKKKEGGLGNAKHLEGASELAEVEPPVEIGVNRAEDLRGLHHELGSHGVNAHGDLEGQGQRKAAQK